MRMPKSHYDDKELLALLGEQESQSIEWGDQYADRLIDSFNVSETGDCLPWSKTEDKIRLRPKELSLWAGINGHKKSMLLGMVLLWLSRKTRVGILSFELPVEKTMQRLCYQAAGCLPGNEFASKFAAWNHERICYYDQMDVVPSERVLGVVYHMAKMGCKHIAIDSLMMCGLTKGEGDQEARFVQTLAAAAKGLEVHIHLVTHVRKPPNAGDEYVPTRFDVRGAGEIVDKADNLFIVWENKRRRSIKYKKSKGLAVSEKEGKYFIETCDQKLITAKQRFGEYEGITGLWFHNDSLQFIPEDANKAIRFNL